MIVIVTHTVNVAQVTYKETCFAPKNNPKAFLWFIHSSQHLKWIKTFNQSCPTMFEQHSFLVLGQFRKNFLMLMTVCDRICGVTITRPSFIHFPLATPE